MNTQKFTVAGKTIILDPSTIAILYLDSNSINIAIAHDSCSVFQCIGFYDGGTNAQEDNNAKAQDLFDKIAYAWTCHNDTMRNLADAENKHLVDRLHQAQENLKGGA